STTADGTAAAAADRSMVVVGAVALISGPTSASAPTCRPTPTSRSLAASTSPSPAPDAGVETVALASVLPPPHRRRDGLVPAASAATRLRAIPPATHRIPAH